MGQGRSAGFQPAVSQCFQPADVPTYPAARGFDNVVPIGNQRYSRLETGWKPALRRPRNYFSLMSNGLLATGFWLANMRTRYRTNGKANPRF